MEKYPYNYQFHRTTSPVPVPPDHSGGPAPTQASLQQTVTAIPVIIQLNGDPQRMTCPHCRAEIVTRVKRGPGRMAHIAALVLCLVGCWCCVFTPYLLDSCQDSDHECPNPSCKKYIGHYRR